MQKSERVSFGRKTHGLTRKFEIMERNGLHARAATLLVQVASRFESTVRIAKGDLEADGKSILSVLLLAAEQGSMVRVTVEGGDEDEAMNAIAAVMGNALAETERESRQQLRQGS